MSADALDMLMTSFTAGVCLVLHVCLALLLVELFFVNSNRMARFHMVVVACGLVLTFLVLYVLESGMTAVYLTIAPAPILMPVLRLPVWAYVAASLVIALCVVVEGALLHRWQRTHVTPTAIKEALDQHPHALAFFDARGLPVLVNQAMENLCRGLVGHEVRSLGQMTRALHDAGEGTRGDNELLVRLEDGRVWLAHRGSVRADGENYVQISATDITDIHELTNELRVQNAALNEQQEHLREFGRSVREVTRAKEVLDAKTTVHDEMGHVLLMTQHYAAEPSSYDGDRLMELWGRVLDGLTEGIAHHDAEEADALKELVEVAAAMGIMVTIEGAPPQEERFYALMARAVRECMLNVGKHAHGSELHVRFSREGRVAEFWNDGDAPNGPIAETGGLRTLRQRVEAQGGTMRVESTPAFRLILSFL